MHRLLRSFAILASALVAAACADLAGVREFAALSSSITGSGEFSARWRDTEPRLKAIPQPGDVPITLSMADRAPVHRETEKMLAAVTRYMDVMGQLASDELPSVDTQVAGLTTALGALPGTPITPQRVEAVGVLVSLLSKPLDAYRHARVRHLIAAADAPLQDILEGLHQLAAIYRADLKSEHKLIRDWVALQVAGTGTSGADFLARRYSADLDRKYLEVDEGIQAYMKALRLIGARHESLINGLASRETIQRTLLQLRATRLELIDARERIRQALAQKVV